MIIKKPIWSLFILLAVAGWSHQFALSKIQTSSIPHFQITVPKVSVDLSDLDLRDSNNRPIQISSALRQMQNLFAQNLKDLLLQNLTPQKKELFSRLAKTWDLFSGWLRKNINRFRSISDIFWEGRKIFVEQISAFDIGRSVSGQGSLFLRPFYSSNLIHLIVSTTQLTR